MNITCLIGWHKWSGCKCIKCNHSRNKEHDWATDCETCSKCGKTRVMAHDWFKVCEKCSKCGKVRKNAHKLGVNCECSQCRIVRHSFVPGECLCKTCGVHTTESYFWKSDYRCNRCGSWRMLNSAQLLDELPSVGSYHHQYRTTASRLRIIRDLPPIKDELIEYVKSADVRRLCCIVQAMHSVVHNLEMQKITDIFSEYSSFLPKDMKEYSISNKKLMNERSAAEKYGPFADECFYRFVRDFDTGKSANFAGLSTTDKIACMDSKWRPMEEDAIIKIRQLIILLSSAVAPKKDVNVQAGIINQPFMSMLNREEREFLRYSIWTAAKSGGWDLKS